MEFKVDFSKNTEFEYMHRDEGNYKEMKTVIFRGWVDTKQLHAFLHRKILHENQNWFQVDENCKNSEECECFFFFIPEEVKLEPARVINPAVDPVFHEFYLHFIRPTEEETTDPRRIDEFLNDLAKAPYDYLGWVERYLKTHFGSHFEIRRKGVEGNKLF